jgi:copper resistance protein B
MKALLMALVLLAAPAAAQHAGHTMPAPPPAADVPGFETPPPPEAGKGPPSAADAIWGAEVMRPSRAALKAEGGDMTRFWFMADRAEVRINGEATGYLWDVQGYWGGDTAKLWLKSEGEGGFGEAIDDAEIQALYSRAIAPFFDLQLGVRRDLAPFGRNHAVLGIQGLARYRFEVDAALFLSDQGDLTARIEAELDQRLTQRLVLQPRTEIGLAAQDIPELGIGAGIDTISLGVRLRYEIVREFAPYIGVEQDWRIGGSADYARAQGTPVGITSFVVGVRLWF